MIMGWLQRALRRSVKSLPPIAANVAIEYPAGQTAETSAGAVILGDGTPITCPGEPKPYPNSLKFGHGCYGN